MGPRMVRTTITRGGGRQGARRDGAVVVLTERRVEERPGDWSAVLVLRDRHEQRLSCQVAEIDQRPALVDVAVRAAAASAALEGLLAAGDGLRS